ncbi:hotdog fold thioesterase [Mangrovivirga cuniculi]|uniref:Phenylacetic acid degradation protein n=1 Tax=Mangrovivirga cuniculi TaxID=2715131 RepID=A0A4D7K5Q8_9BACT|nr:hotdog fold thioesterase [Mangrovivirga cuniculi]QCK16144.1 phenylacetic acid degradation protein [Mangrovivirga cuniculi]
MEDKIREYIIRAAEEEIPIHRFLGLKVEKLELDFVRVSVPYSEEFVGDIRKSRWHGGIIGLIMDSVGGMIGIANFTSKKDKLATIDLRIDYLRGAEAYDVVVEGNLVRLGSRIMVANMQAFQKGQLVAEGKGVYNFVRA